MNRAGIDELMIAEQKAAQKIQQARTDAKNKKAQLEREAETEINAYKQTKAAEFEEIRRAGDGGSDSRITALTADATRACDVLRSEYQQNKDACAEMLASIVVAGNM